MTWTGASGSAAQEATVDSDLESDCSEARHSNLFIKSRFAPRRPVSGGWAGANLFGTLGPLSYSGKLAGVAEMGRNEPASKALLRKPLYNGGSIEKSSRNGALFVYGL